MKRCPECRRDYFDETLIYCLDDGARLLDGAGISEPRTQILPGRTSGERSAKNAHGQVAAPKSHPAKDLDKQISMRSGRVKWAVGVAAAVILASAGLLAYRYWPRGESSKPIDSIAVLPFQDKNVGEDSEYLSTGIAESLIYRLSQLPNLKVSPTSTVFRYQGQDVDPLNVGSELGVRAVLSGRIVRHGDNITISAELADVANHQVLWGEQYDRKMSELLETQREIAKEIVENLKLKVSANEKGLVKHYTESSEAYQAYLKGRYYWNKRNNESMRKSIDFYKQAIEIDPSFALAYTGLADTYNLICAPEAGGGDEAPNDMLPKAKAAALKALEIDPSLAEAHVSLAHPLYHYDRDWAGAEREFTKAIELNPRYSIAHHWYALYLTVVGRQEEALTEIKKALELDPLSLSINAWYGWILVYNDQPDAALEQLLKTKEMDPSFILTHLRLSMVYADRKNYPEAIAEANELKRISAGRLGSFSLAYAYALSGRRKEALEELSRLMAMSKGQYIAPGSIALVYAALGDKDTAFAWLEKANAEHDLMAVRLKTDHRFASLRDDPRYPDLLKRMGLSQ